MARGGFRPGAGRPKGALGRKSRVAQAAAAVSVPATPPIPDFLVDDPPARPGTADPSPDVVEPSRTVPPGALPLSPAAAAALDELIGEDPAFKNATPLEYGLLVMRDPKVDAERRDRLAIALLPYLHKRVADARQSVKEQRLKAAKAASSGQSDDEGVSFAPSAPPKLAVVGGKK